MFIKLLIFLSLVSVQQIGFADRLHVAVASNFTATMKALAPMFKSTFGHDLIISSGSTGQLYAQIKQGAPYDIYLAADIERPQLLVDEGLATAFNIYARGQLALVANRADCQTVMLNNDLKYLAIANPDLAPYGLAARQFLENKSLWNKLSDRLVMGENVSQAMHLVISKNATAGLVAQSIVVNYNLSENQCSSIIENQFYEPIEQAMVMLNRSSKSVLMIQFLDFIQSKQAIEVLYVNGYLAPLNK